MFGLVWLGKFFAVRNGIFAGGCSVICIMGNSESRALVSDYLDELGQCDLAVDAEAAPMKEEFWTTIFGSSSRPAITRCFV